MRYTLLLHIAAIIIPTLMVFDPFHISTIIITTLAVRDVLVLDSFVHDSTSVELGSELRRGVWAFDTISTPLTLL